MKIQPKPIPDPARNSSPPPTEVAPNAAALPTAPARPSAPTLPPHVWENRTFAEMPDRASPEWGNKKPQLTVITGDGELAKIPKHPAQMAEGELMRHYFDPGYSFDKATGKSSEPFFAQPGHLLESPTREMPAPNLLSSPAAAQPTPGLWGGAPVTPAPVQQPSHGLWGGSTLTSSPIEQHQTPAAQGLWGTAPQTPARTEPPRESERAVTPEAAPLLPHERVSERESPPQTDRFAGFEGWGRNAGNGARNDYYGSDWD